MFKQKASWRFAKDRVGYAVGDVHGRADLLARMFEVLERDAQANLSSASARPLVIFLGDYIDRGPDSAEVIDLLLLGRPEGFERRFLKGNHEAAMLAFLDDPVTHRSWLEHGGLETLASYKTPLMPTIGSSASEIVAARDAFAKVLPAKHRAFFTGLERFASIGDYLFVHAGVDPAKDLAGQSDADLFWIRRRFLNDTRRYDQCVVHGHTPVDQPFRDLRRVGLDTGAYYSGRLSAACFEGEAVRFLSADLARPQAG